MFYDEFSLGQILSLKERLPDREKSIHNFIIVSRYYIDCGKDEQFIRKTLFKLISSSYEGMNDKFIKATVDKSMSLALSRPPLVKKEIIISEDELNYIHSFDNEPLERIMFIMLCLYKCNDCTSFSVSKRFLNSETKLNKNINSLYRLLHVLEKEEVFVSKIYQGKMYYEVGEEIKKLSDNCEPFLTISNKKNIIYYYLDFVKSNGFIICKNCGCIDNRKGNAHEYCEHCYGEKYTERYKKYNKKRRKPQIKLE